MFVKPLKDHYKYHIIFIAKLQKYFAFFHAEKWPHLTHSLGAECKLDCRPVDFPALKAKTNCIAFLIESFQKLTIPLKIHSL